MHNFEMDITPLCAKRPLCRPQAANYSDYFSPRPVRGEKYFSQSECRAAKGGEAQSGAQTLSFLRNGKPFLKNEIGS